MERREAVKYITVLMGMSMVGADAMLLGCKSKTGKTLDFSTDDIAFLNEVGETIIPQTSTPGAKAADVGRFMTVMVNDCYEEIDQKTFMDGMKKLDDASQTKFNNPFMKINAQQKQELLIAIDKESKEYQKTRVKQFNDEENKKEKEAKAEGKEYKKQRISPHYFSMMKQLTLQGYFTSEVGSKSINYKQTPTRYDGCVPYTKGVKIIA